ncbi:MAG: DNA-3-methyladenine glycosylase 2 family protein [Burkholderiales bacterium]|nr:DNA-3-methyladenine glycosylase 2 family protein [Burkholderiales bacterium]
MATHDAMTAPRYWPEATRALAARDPVLATLIPRHRALALGSRGDAFQTLARAIVGQQISVKAAQNVWDRFVATVEAMAPAAVARADTAALRAAGLSLRKAEYVQDLARRFCEGTVDAASWVELDDEAIIEQLVQVRGIGRWTAEMFLIFNLARPDVLPLADLGLQRALSANYNRGRPLSARRIGTITRSWAPWRSVATWYMWRSLESAPTQY